MMSLELVGIIIPGVAVISGLAGLAFGVAGTVLHINKKGDNPKEDLIRQAKLTASTQSLQKG